MIMATANWRCTSILLQYILTEDKCLESSTQAVLGEVYYLCELYLIPPLTVSLPAFPEYVSRLLNSRVPRMLEREDCGRAAVLIPIFQASENYHFLLTLRTQSVETHKGQISFPGGVMELQDPTLWETALRETWEEIGIPPEKICPLGVFDEYLSVTDLIVTPYVGWLELPFELNINQSEVEEVLHVPFSLFQDVSKLRVETRNRQGEEIQVYFYDFGGKEIWGLTARIIRDFLMLLGEQN
jgi:8-oxo-dGTP pyrophosphatase MutT (NUDIX family)